MVKFVPALSWAGGLLDAWLAAMATRPAGALLTVPTLRLFTAVTAIGKGMVPGDFMECTFSGYASATPTFSAPVSGGSNSRALELSSLFIATTVSPFVGENVLGVYLTDDANSVVYGAAEFDRPANIAGPGDWLDVVVQAALGSAQDA